MDLKSKRVAVFGDIILDRFIRCNPVKLSSEAPVPVVLADSEESYLGGAANVAKNLQALRQQVVLAGVVGQDTYGREVMDIICQDDLTLQHILFEGGLKTTVKSRVVVDGQQICRVDREDTKIPNKVQDLFALAEHLQSMDAICIADYGKGIVSTKLLQILSEYRNDIPVVLDPYCLYEWGGKALAGMATVIKPNRKEAEFWFRRRINTPDDIENAASFLRDLWECQAVLLTLGAQGAVLATEGGIDWVAAENPLGKVDITGAGDTGLSAFTAALASGASYVEAAKFSMEASNIVVSKPGIATATLAEIKESRT